jgi:hypothetical protein
MLLLSLLTVARAGAQYYDTGQDPASLRWRQIHTPHFRLIYPEDFEAGAKDYAQLLEQSYNSLSSLYPDGKTKIPVIIHNHSMSSNGYVSWAPRRMELYPLPGQDNLPMLPAEQLAVHETAHVLQLSSLNRKGPARVLRYLIGEQAVGLSALEIPMWAFEGDAVYAETVTGLSGRGRSNAFTQRARALAVSEPGIYSYDKMLSGSYRHFTPDHYVFGYLMMNHLRSIDSSAWTKAVRRVSSGYPFNPVNNSLKRTTDMTKRILYDSTFALLERTWKEHDLMGYREYPALSLNEKRDYVSHYTPHRSIDGKIVSLRTSLSDPSRFVITDTNGGTEHVLTTTGYIYPYIFSYSDSTLVWSEQHPDIRWDNRDYSVIKRMDIGGGPVKQLTHRTRYTAPDLSPDGKTIVTVSTTTELRCSLVFLDALTGEVLMDVVPPDNLILQRPAWSSDGRAVTVVTLNGDGEGIRTYRPTGKRWTLNMRESVTDIIQAELHNDTLYYLAQGDGSDNIYRLTGDSVVTRVTASRFGISGFSVSGEEILFSDYTADGFVMASENLRANVGPAEKLTHEVFPEVAPMPAAMDEEPLQMLPDLESKPYRKTAHLFNFHSWFPFYGDIDEIQTDPTAISPGLTLMSQNHLSTLVSTVGYEYSGGNHYFRSGIKWSGWHPVINAEISYGGDQVVSKDTVTRPGPGELTGDLHLNVSIYDQLWFAYGRFRQLLMPAVYLDYRNKYTWISGDNSYDRDMVYLTGRLYFSNTFRTAYRDINPRWGQVIDLRITAAPWDRDLYRSMRFVRSTFFLPGVASNHSLALRAGYENQSPSRKLIFNNAVAWPRGFERSLVAEKLLSLSADYTMPLFYPDLAAGSLLYLKRIRGSVYFDYSRAKGIYDYNAGVFNPNPADFSSMGTELLADFYVLRFPFEISAGAGAGYIPGESRFFVKGVFSVNIYGTVLGRER